QAVFVSLTASHQDFVRCEIDVLDTKLQTSENPQARTVKQHRHELRCAVQSRDHLLHFFRCQHDRQSDRPLGASNRIHLLQRCSEHFAVQERYRRHRLVLCRTTDVITNRKSREELHYIILSELRWMARSVEPNVANHPANVGSNGPLAILAK